MSNGTTSGGAPGKSCAILQSNYIPWKGYFDLINVVDEFVIYDCVQFTRRDWRNRQKIKGPHGCQWLTIPVKAKGNYYANIDEIEVVDGSWADSHWTTLKHNYARAPFFAVYADGLSKVYEQAAKLTRLTEINRLFLEHLCAVMSIKTLLRDSREFELQDGRNERLLGICKQVQAQTYYSGTLAKSYLDEALFASHGIAVEWFEYAGYPQYDQLYGEFEHGVSILDLLFSVGPAFHQYMRTFDVIANNRV